NAISMLRQQMRPTDRVHGVITRGGVKPNIIPDHTSAEFYVRARNLSEVESLRARVMACFEGAAIATGCRLEHRSHHPPYTDMRTNDVLANAYMENMAALGLSLPAKEQLRNAPSASTDMGNVSYVVPSIHPFFGIPAQFGNHHPGFTEAAATPEAHENALLAATGLAWTAIDAFTSAATLQAAQQEFRDRVKR
ncbi:MAG: peptidase dimerization domain-containing protein, partial [Dehalococcoidia bacterium]